MKGTERDEDVLRSALRAVADDDALLNTSSAVEQRLLAELNARARVRRIHSRLLQIAAAAVFVVAVGLPLWYVSSRKAVVPLAQPGVPAGAATREEVTEFFPLAYSDVPAPGGYVVRMQVPRTALTSFGVIGFSAADDRSPTVAADVLVGGDGLARAVRFVQMVRDTRQEQP
jgi:hypothetical protein